MIDCRRVLGIAVLMFALTLSTAAQDGLYGPSDSDDALVRVIHAVENSSLLPVDLGATSFGRVGFGDVTPYRPVFPGMFVLRAEGREFSFNPRSGSYYSLIYGPQGFLLIEDEIHDDPARAQLVLYNLAQLTSVSLEAFAQESPDQRTPIVAGVPSGSARGRVLNPVPVSFAVSAGDDELTTIDTLPLSRGGSVSVLVMGSPEAPRVVVAEASVAFD
jgi:hypothetical protein